MKANTEKLFLEEDNNIILKDLIEETKNTNKVMNENLKETAIVPNSLKCFICEGKISKTLYFLITLTLDFCNNPYQAKCCYENFCEDHIKKHLNLASTCPKCNEKATLTNFVQNKRLKIAIDLIKKLYYNLEDVVEKSIPEENKEEKKSQIGDVEKEKSVIDHTDPLKNNEVKSNIESTKTDDKEAKLKANEELKKNDDQLSTGKAKMNPLEGNPMSMFFNQVISN